MRSRKEDNEIRKQLWLEQCAWANRRVMTPSELRLWSALSARKLGVQSDMFEKEKEAAHRQYASTQARGLVGAAQSRI